MQKEKAAELANLVNDLETDMRRMEHRLYYLRCEVYEAMISVVPSPPKDPRDEALKVAREVLEHAKDALKCWVNTYAPEHCSSDSVNECATNIWRGGGTLAYIARHNGEIREAIRQIKEIMEEK